MAAASVNSSKQPTRQTRRRVVRARRTDLEFKNIHMEGALLSGDLLAALSAGDPSIKGLRAEDFNLLPGERLGERVSEAWAKLQRTWELFQQERSTLPANDYGTTLTRSRWLLPLLKVLDYSSVAYNRKGEEFHNKTYLLSHTTSEPVALHLTSFRQDLDKRDEENLSGSRYTPHALMQEYLNVNSGRLWGFLSNGLRFRLMRENSSYVHSSYLEFDLEGIMETASYSEFYLFFILVHQSRLARRDASLEACDETPDDEPASSKKKGKGSGKGKSPDSAADDEDSGAAGEAARVETTPWLESWRAVALQNGVRALEDLCGAVQNALERLGQGFLERPENRLRERLNSGSLTKETFYHDLLRIVYRFLFLLIAEDRELFFAESTAASTRSLYRNYYSAGRLRKLSRRLRGSRHYDLWEQLKRTFEWCRDGQEQVGAPAFGSELFNSQTVFDDCRVSNTVLLAAVRALTHTTKNDVLQPIDYKHLGVEELGSVYETLLEKRPEIGSNSFELRVLAGNERKTSGSYYTPPELVDSLLETALDPVVEEALKGASDRDGQERALLNLKICDPACGSGHFLVGAARRLGKRLAQLRTGDVDPSPLATHLAVRDVVAHCLYGVDINPMAVELCKVSLWIESMAPGKGLKFLDHHLKCGNSLVGATPELLKQGIPDAAFDPIEGDDRKTCQELKKYNKKYAHGQLSLLSSEDEAWDKYRKELVEDSRRLNSASNDSAKDYLELEEKYAATMESLNKSVSKLAADVWCCAFFWAKKRVYGETNLTNESLSNVKEKGQYAFSPHTLSRIEKTAKESQFFHWHLEFPDVFGYEEKESQDPSSPRKGFDVVLGNPPWELIQFQEKEWFDQRDESVVNAMHKASRAKMIEALEETNPKLYEEYQKALRKTHATSLFLRESGKYPLCGCGKINLYAIFAELDRQLISSSGRAGFIVPSGIATDATTQAFFQNLIECSSLCSLYDFENRDGLFPSVHRSFKFTLLTTSGSSCSSGATLSFFNLRGREVNESGRFFTLQGSEIAMMNPNTGTCPIFRSVKDAELTKGVYRRVPVLLREARGDRAESNPWGVSFMQMFNMSTASNLFHTREALEGGGYALRGARFYAPDGDEFWPLYEAKMVHHYNHRFGDYADLPKDSKSTQLPRVPAEKLRDKNYAIMPRYWVNKREVLEKYKKEAPFLLGFRDITNTTNERTNISAVVPFTGVGHKYPVLRQFKQPLMLLPAFIADTSSFIHDYLSRQKLSGTSMSYFVLYQIPKLPPESYGAPFTANESYSSFILPRVLELTYTSDDVRGFATSVGDSGEPFLWDDERRFLLRCELDALYFGLYLGWGDWSVATVYPESPADNALLREHFPTPVDALDHVMESFPIVKRKELADDERRAVAESYLARHGLPLGDRYPTHAVVRAIYEEMTLARRTNAPWRSWLDVPPADDSCRHPS